MCVCVCVRVYAGLCLHLYISLNRLFPDVKVYDLNFHGKDNSEGKLATPEVLGTVEVAAAAPETSTAASPPTMPATPAVSAAPSNGAAGKMASDPMNPRPRTPYRNIKSRLCRVLVSRWLDCAECW